MILHRRVKWKLPSWNYPADAPIIDRPFHQYVSVILLVGFSLRMAPRPISHLIWPTSAAKTVAMATKRKWVMFSGTDIARGTKLLNCTMEKLTVLQYVWSSEIDCAGQVTLRMSTHAVINTWRLMWSLHCLDPFLNKLMEKKVSGLMET